MECSRRQELRRAGARATGPETILAGSREILMARTNHIRPTVLGLLVVFSWLWFTGCSGNAAAPPPPPPVSVTSATVVQKDRKSTRLNSSHLGISYAVFC